MTIQWRLLDFDMKYRRPFLACSALVKARLVFIKLKDALCACMSERDNMKKQYIQYYTL